MARRSPDSPAPRRRGARRPRDTRAWPARHPPVDGARHIGTPDAVQWTPDGNRVTADEGDLAAEPSGGRGWTVFSPARTVVFTSGASAEKARAAAGRYPDGHSDDKGAEFEGAEVAYLRGTDYAFIGSERGDSVLVYDVGNEASPRLLQVLPTGEAPKGLLAVQRQHLFLTSNEDDGTISIFQLGGR